jgi:hypothetical protein
VQAVSTLQWTKYNVTVNLKRLVDLKKFEIYCGDDDDDDDDDDGLFRPAKPKGH